MNEIKVRMSKLGPIDIDHDMAGIVPMASDEEQSSLTDDIDNNQQKDPIVLWRGRVVDGRCRQLALTMLGHNILYRELDPTLTEEEVKIFVKSVNTRRNLTQTQKVIAACKQSLDPSNNKSVELIAKGWGVSKKIVDNARYIQANAPEMMEPLFNGKSIIIVNKDGREVSSNKITAIYAYVRKAVELVSQDEEHAWNEDSYIITQRGKEWYYDQVRESRLSESQVQAKMLIAELANYKFRKVDKETGEIL